MVGPASEKYEQLLDYDLTFYSDARRFEIMTLAVQDLIAMGSSLELLLELGLDAIEVRCRQLSDRLINGLAHCDSTSIITPVSPSKRAGIVTVAVPDSLATSKRLSEAGSYIHEERTSLDSRCIFTTRCPKSTWRLSI